MNNLLCFLSFLPCFLLYPHHCSSNSVHVNARPRPRLWLEAVQIRRSQVPRRFNALPDGPLCRTLCWLWVSHSTWVHLPPAKGLHRHQPTTTTTAAGQQTKESIQLDLAGWGRQLIKQITRKENFFLYIDSSLFFLFAQTIHNKVCGPPSKQASMSESTFLEDSLSSASALDDLITAAAVSSTTTTTNFFMCMSEFSLQVQWPINNSQRRPMITHQGGRRVFFSFYRGNTQKVLEDCARLYKRAHRGNRIPPNRIFYFA